MKSNHLVHKLSILVYFATLFLGGSLAQYTAREGETFRNLISVNSYLLLGSSEAIYRFNGSLEMYQQKKSLSTPNRLLVADYVGSFMESFLSCDNTSCFLAQITNFNNVSWQVNPPIIRTVTPDNAVGVFAPRANGTSDLTYGERAGRNQARLFVKGSLVNAGTTDGSSSYSFLEYARRDESSRFDPLIYLTEFPLRYANNNSGFVYFVTRPEDEVRIVRFCEDDPGSDRIFVSHFEAVLQCGSTGRLASGSTAATFLNTSSAFGGRPTILVTQTRIISMGQMQLEVCSFDIGVINSLMSEIYNKCIDARDNTMSGFVRDGRDGCTAVPQRSRPFVSECFLPGTARPGLEVVSPYIQAPLASLPFNSVATAITHATLDNSLFLFAATEDGQLVQFYISDPTTSSHVRTINLNLGQEENVTKMVASNNGEYVFAMTPSRLLRHTVDRCNNFTSCTECLTSGDPICGWCPLSGTCTRNFSCASVPPAASSIWLDNITTCPRIEIVDPPIVYIPELENGNVPFTMTTTNIATTLLSDYSYSCQFCFKNANNHIVTMPATRTNTVFNCDSPPRHQVPELNEGQDTLDTMISLTVVGGNVSIASFEMTLPFTNCAAHQSCTSCIGDNRCVWCPFSFSCIRPGTMCAPNQNEPTVNSSGICPQIFPSSATGQYLIHANHSYPEHPLRINSTDLRQFSPDFNRGLFRCHICSQSDASCVSPLFNTPASLAMNGDEIICEMARFDSNLMAPSVNMSLRVVYNNQRTIDNPNNSASVILYSCPLMGTNCAQCLAQELRFDCSYCVMGSKNETNRSGACRLQTTCPVGDGFQSFVNPEYIDECPAPQISDFKPKAGPTRGGTTLIINGTNLGASRDDIVNVTINGVGCKNISHNPGISITCITREHMQSVATAKIYINFKHLSQAVKSSQKFAYVAPALSTVEPNYGPQSGGTNITIMGMDIGVGSSHRAFVGGEECTVTTVTRSSIMCTTSRSDQVSSSKELVRVVVDNWEQDLAGFEYREDPEFDEIKPTTIFPAGGVNYTIKGRNFQFVQAPRLLIYYEGVPSITRGRRQTEIYREERFESEPCDVQNQRMVCTAPRLSDDDFNQTSRPLRIGLLMDGVTALLELPNASLSLFPNPTFESFPEEQVLSIGNTISLIIKGTGFVFNTSDVKVTIEPCNRVKVAECLCEVTRIFPNNSLSCDIDILTQSELPVQSSLEVKVVIGNIMEVPGTIRLQDNLELAILYYLIPVFAVVLISAAVIFIVLVAIFCRKTRQKDRKYDQLILELEKLESSVARECKIGFAELQTDLDELTGDVVGCRLPYRDLQSYLLTTLFPGVAGSHPILQPIQIPTHQRPIMDRVLKDFSSLLLDKRTLLIFIRSMEEQRAFTIRDKSIVGSLLIVALHNKLDYATEVLKSLLSELIRRTVQNAQPKLLLRRTESVAEKMLTNWLAFCLHGYVMEHVGQPMYLLYRAVKNQLEKGPIDVITGEARYSLSEQKLIRQKVEVVQLDANVETEDGLRVPVKLLDCDTISQAKEKILDAVHKAAPVSQRPTLTRVDLEYIKSSTERAILRDEDSTTVKEGEWKKINTLKHYWIKNGALFRLIPRRDYAPPGRAYDYPGSLISSHTPRQRALSEAEDGTRVWHLFKQLDVEDPKRSPFMNKKLVSEIYLPRMLSTKSILQKFADDLFHSLFSISHPPSSPIGTYMAVYPNSPGVQVPMGYAPGADAVPMAVKYLFDFLDDEAEAVKIFDGDVVHTWKNNALSLRFWVNLIKNPEFVFDINKSHTVDACLSVIAQAFIDGCSSSEMKLTIDSPTSKLLYNKEVQGYKAEVKQYYDSVKHLPRIPEDAMQYYLRQLSSYQAQQMKRTGGFFVESAVHDLLRYAAKYHEPFLVNLRTAGLQSKAQLFEGVLKVFSN